MPPFLRILSIVMGGMTIALMAALITAGNIPQMAPWQIKLGFGFGLICGVLCFALGLLAPKPIESFLVERRGCHRQWDIHEGA